MIELIENIPANVLGFEASEQVTANDYETVLIPAVETRLKQHDKIRMLYHLGPTFSGFTSGAMWDDAKLGLGHRKSWQKIAIVTDLDWIKSAIGLFEFIIPCPFKVFANSQYANAISWVAS